MGQIFGAFSEYQNFSNSVALLYVKGLGNESGANKWHSNNVFICVLADVHRPCYWHLGRHCCPPGRYHCCHDAS